MAIPAEHPMQQSSDRQRRARQVVGDVVRQIIQGEDVNDQSILSQHPELLPDLADELRKASRIGAAFREADEQHVTAAFNRLRDDCAGDSSVRPETPLAVESSEPEWIGRYRVERMIGQGGFGKVLLAWDEELTRRVAIKTPHRRRLSDPESVATYLAEARVLAKLDHPGIVPVYDAGRTPDGGCYVVSKWIQGVDLATRLRQTRLSHEEAVRLAIEIAGALHHAHAQGIVHRDIKPANILLDGQERPCLVDFGLAVRDDELNDSWRWAGTPLYMSPEQARGEAHRIDGRSDIFSLGVVLYESLTGHRPFNASSHEQLLEQIVSLDPRPPRQWDDAIAPELERICLKTLAKRAADRYTTAKDLMVDLRHFLLEDSATAAAGPRGEATETGATAISDDGSAAVRIVPKGLRCFDAGDAEFFRELLPGPRDRHGLPESIRQWKVRVEEADADESFAVGLLYGPSGCGKSSFVRAGLLPQLASHVESLYIEATPDETESQLLKRLQRKIPDLPVEAGLAKCLVLIRRGFGVRSGHKLLLVIDQFEQWLSGRPELDRRPLVEALRQCDGPRLQCLLLVRDDFWLAVSRFMSELEVELVQGRTTSLVDLFDPRHARKVLVELGRAYGRLPNNLDELTSIQHGFLDRAVAGLDEEGKIIPVRLALFVEMVKGRPWTPDTLRDMGGSQGVGVTFLEETFCARTANPRNRTHERAARAVLEALLPKPGSPIKGHVRSYPELLDLSGYGHRPREFKELMRILDGETRLLTPADLIVDGPTGDTSLPALRYYQLTHDYLVPSLREWLTKKQKATPTGRAELRLAERSAMWNSTRERRQLPSLWEWLNIRALTRTASWTETQRKMMRVAARRHALWSATWLAVGILLLLISAELTTSAKNLFLHIRAGTVPLWLAFGQEEAIFPLLQKDSDPTVRTGLIHRFSPLLITSEQLVTRATEPLDPSVRRALLLGAGEMIDDSPSGAESSVETRRRSVSDKLVRQLTQLYLEDPDPGIHSAAEWTLRRYQQQTELDRIDSQLTQLKTTSPQIERQWYVTGEGHTLVVIPGPVRFRMGSLSPGAADEGDELLHEQMIHRSFSIASKETTVAQFQRFLFANPAIASTNAAGLRLIGDAPVLQVTWYQAAAYCNWLNLKEDIARDQWCFVPNGQGEYAAGMSLAPNWLSLRGYRLPTEAEWEYACRAGAETDWFFGSDATALSEYATGAATSHREPSPVGMLKPNDFGLFDVLGNAAEWCLDRYRTGSDSKAITATNFGQWVDPVQNGDPRVIRGGSYTDDSSRLRNFSRGRMLPAQPAATVGFRVARSYP